MTRWMFKALAIDFKTFSWIFEASVDSFRNMARYFKTLAMIYVQVYIKQVNDYVFPKSSAGYMISKVYKLVDKSALKLLTGCQVSSVESFSSSGWYLEFRN